MDHHLYTLDDLDPAAFPRRGTDGGLRGRRVLVRVDFNVPLADGRVMDSTRIEEALPTIRELVAAGARAILVSHCGRPKGKRDPRFSLRPVAERLGELLGANVVFGDDCVGDAARQAVDQLADGDVCLLENLRYHAGETKNDPDLAAQLAELAELYVGDAFGTAHRAHASVVGAAERLPHKVAGRLMVREVEALSRLLGEVERPFAVILGGAKIEGKIDTLENLLPRLDLLMVGGGIANTFFAARGVDLRKSLYDAERVELAKQIMARADEGYVLPIDLIVTDNPDDPRHTSTVRVEGEGAALPPDTMAVDVGEATRALFAEKCAGAKTIFWNGPLGVFEKPPFDAGTQAVASSLGKTSAYTVIGGGETVAAARRAGVADRLSHVSTGGGASLELLAGKALPGVEILRKSS
ncbi:MAG: phosphoglycerate kinase [bacterium]|nr:phosphoglycerate kinase [bacterium]